ncbi:MAG: HAD family hydrolase, partial [Chloroflexota bacterium]
MSPLGRQAVFLDRDGTLSRYMEYCCHPEEFELLPGAAEAIRRLNDAGMTVVVATNQSAIGRGWLTPETLAQIHEKMRRQLEQAGARVDAIYVCPHHPDDGCACRKPNTGMLEQASRELGVSLEASYVIGDRLLDVRMGRAAGSS